MIIFKTDKMETATPITHRIDCCVEPLIPAGLTKVHQHLCNGVVQLDFSKIELYSPDMDMTGAEIRVELMRRNVKLVNVNFMDHVLRHKELIELIPKDFEGKDLFSLGTVFLNHTGVPCAAYFTRGNHYGSIWREHYRRLDQSFKYFPGSVVMIHH